MNVAASSTCSLQSRSTGFSLVEVLVSIVVLSIGLLGMVGMQAASLQANREARLQSNAVVLARELAEMIRGNKDIGVLHGTVNPYLGDFNTSPLAPAAPQYCLTSGCGDTTLIAKAQMTEWLARVNEQLPGARVTSCFDSTPYSSAGVGQWACTNASTDDVIMIKIGWTRGATDRSKTGADALERATTPAVVMPVTAGAAS